MGGAGVPFRLALSEVNGSNSDGGGEGLLVDSSSADPEDAVIFVGISLVLGIASRQLLRGTRIPYTVALLVLGIALGAVEHGTSHGLGKLGDGIRLWSNINPDLLLIVFLPALLFESAFSMEIHQIKKCIVQMILLAGPGVIISTFCLGSAVKITFPYNWSWTTSLLLGGLLSATDPVAVVALLKELGASKKLNTIIEGESLMNDGTAIVVYQLFYEMVGGQKFGVGDIVSFLAKVSLGAVAIGFAFGVISVLWLGIIFNDTVIEITLTLAVSYIAFYTAQDGAEVSGVLTVMTLGMFYAAFGRTAFKGDGQESLHHFWEMVAYIANTLIFILSGVVIAEGVLKEGDARITNHGTSWGYLILLYVFVQLSRVVNVCVLYPFLRYFGYGLEWKEAVILIWSGLRGAVALALSLSVKRASDSLHLSNLQPDDGIHFVFFTGGIVFFTLIVNGSTTQFVLHFLKMDKLSAEKVRILDYTRYELLNKAMEAFGDLGDDEELGPADWPTVKKYIRCLNDLEGEREHPHTLPENDHDLHHMNLKDMRVRLLNGVQSAYWEMLDEGRITQGTGMLLMQSVDEAMDMVSQKESLCDWKGLKTHVHFPSYYRFLQASRIPRRLVTYFTVQRLESACYICAAFLRAHRIARMQLNEFIGESEIASIVINESNVEGEEARKFLEDVRISFPEVLRVVKTKQATYAILKHLGEYLQNLEKVGLLEKKEIMHLEDAVQTDLKKLERNPPLIKVPKLKESLDTHPLLGALPVHMREPLEGSTKETLRVRGATLYKEGSKSNGIWLVLNGVVKWSSNTFKNRLSMHPTFSHGSTLGLYEVLVGKPYICDMIAESVARCCFIEGEKIISLLQTDTDIENFLWQESTIAVAKILVPQVFEKLSLHELRALIAERSRMNIYLSGEVMEVPAGSVCLLLEGFIKNHQAHENLIASPAALIPSALNLSSINLDPSGNARSGSFCFHQGSHYLVEARARVIFFDMQTPAECESPLVRRQPSWISRSDYPKLHSGEHSHSGLMSWPENINRTRSHHQHLLPPSNKQNSFISNKQNSFISNKQNSFTSKAMEVSIFGSTVDSVYKRHQSMPKATMDASLSFPSVPTTGTPHHTLISVQSEGESLGKRLRRREREDQEPSNNVPSNQPPVPLGRAGPNRRAGGNSSDDDSGGEEELIVKIDSPSKMVI